MELYRQCNVFERCLSFYESPGVTRDMRTKILHLVYRSSEVGGSTTLITRAGILSWIQSQVHAARGDGSDVILRLLMRHLYDSCDRERVEKWGGKALAEAVEQMKIE
jgi:nucleolar pre-ribosomal-associated protein 1